MDSDTQEIFDDIVETLIDNKPRLIAKQKNALLRTLSRMAVTEEEREQIERVRDIVFPFTFYKKVK